jgi:hypothetical protein
MTQQNKKLLLKKLSAITDAKPLGEWQETPWNIFKGTRSFIENHVLFLKNKNEISKDTKSALKTFEETFYIKRILEDMILEGYVEGVLWLAENVPYLKETKKILLSAEEKSRSKKSAARLIFRGENYLVYYEGSYFFKSWLTNKIYKLKTDDIFALFPTYESEIKEAKRFNLLDKEFNKLLHSDKDDSKIKIYKFLNKFRRNTANNKIKISPFYFSGITVPQNYHKLVNEWIYKFVWNNKIGNVSDLHKYVEEEAHKLKITTEIKDYLNTFPQNIERNFLALENMRQYVNWISKDQKSSRVYVLRDTISMYECEVTKNILEKSGVNSKTILVNRDMLAYKGQRGYWWAMTSEFLYDALNQGAQNFDQLFKIYYGRIKETINKNKDFKDFIINLGEYLIKEGIYKNKDIVFVDTGVQGSVVILLCAVTEYLKESNLISKDIKADLRLYTVLFYFRDVYKGKYYSDNSSFIRDVEYVKRQEYLYKYLPNSFQKFGYPKIKLSSLDKQLLANVELLCLIELLRRN